MTRLSKVALETVVYKYSGFRDHQLHLAFELWVSFKVFPKPFSLSFCTGVPIRLIESLQIHFAPVLLAKKFNID